MQCHRKHVLHVLQLGQRMLRISTIICVFLLFSAGISRADTKASSNLGWFRDFGLGLNLAGVFQEIATGSKHRKNLAVGPTLQLAVYRFPWNRFALNLSYFYYADEKTEGTKQVSVTNSHNRLDVAVQYDFCWKSLTTGLRMGTGLSITQTTTRLNESFSDLDGNHFFWDGEKKKAVGVVPGFIMGFVVGLNLGRLFSRNRQMDIEILAQGNYFKHEERDDFSLGVSLIVWPMSIVRKPNK